MITHYDLFAGIGGFSLALEEVFNEPIRHIFCEWEKFPTAVLKQHWPDGEFWGDIAELVEYTERKGLEKRQQPREASSQAQNGAGLERRTTNDDATFTIVTGGFPCQPFSHAGRRKGTADDRYQWPNMFAVIRHTKPEWVIAENVRGLVTWNEGVVLETVCSDLESQGYEVQPFIIPAVAVGAPHRRDRVWIIAHRNDPRSRASEHDSDQDRTESHVGRQGQPLDRTSRQGADVTNPRPQRRSEGSSEGIRPTRQEPKQQNRQYPDWSRNWQEVAFATCDDSMDDGLPRLVGGVPYSRARWRKDSLKAYGNGIVPQVAIEIMRAIKEHT